MNCSAASLLVFSATLALGALSHAQGQPSSRFSGRVIDAAGHPDAAAVVRLVSDPTGTPGVHPMRYTIMGDSLGKFSQEGVAPGAYLVMVFTGGKGTDVLRRVQLRPGESAQLTLCTGGANSQVAVIERRTGGSSSPATRTR